MNEKIIKMVVEAKSQKVVILVNSNDQLKINAALQIKDAGIEFKVV